MRLPKTKAERAIVVAIGYVILVMTYFIVPVTTMQGGIFITILILLIIQPIAFGFVSVMVCGTIGVIGYGVTMMIIEIFKWIFKGE